MNKINERIQKIGEDFQEEFVTSAGQLCRVQSVAEFELIFRRMREIVAKFPEFGNSLDWYYARRFHLFPAFHDGLHSGLNLAEVGNAQWKPKHKMSLVAAAKDDITTMLQQESDLKRFGEGSTFKRGKVLTDTQRATKESVNRWRWPDPLLKYFKTRKLLKCRSKVRKILNSSYPEKKLDTNLLRKQKE